VNPAEILLLSRTEVAALLSFDECIAAVENAFRIAGEGHAAPSGILGFPSGEGGFHIKAALLGLSRPYFAAKLNGNFRRNRERFGMPTIQGVIALFDGENGRPLALMDSIEITLLRTAAATAVAARYLARPDSKIALVCGCGAQGRVQLQALARVLPITRVHVYDADAQAAERFSHELGAMLGLEIRPTGEAGPRLRQSDVCVTCTTSRRAFIRAEDVPPGLFIAAVGADSPEKQEVEPTIFTAARLFVDSREQCATIGEWHHAIEAGVCGPSYEVTELAEVIVGAKPGRLSPEEVTVFDSTGIALEDVAAAAAVYEKAVDAGRGQAWRFSDSTQ
jgi:alanine dehydrogenase